MAAGSSLTIRWPTTAWPAAAAAPRSQAPLASSASPRVSDAVTMKIRTRPGPSLLCST